MHRPAMRACARAPAMSPAARRLHREALIVDGLVFLADGSTETLDAANIAAANVTVAHFEADFESACDDMAAWLARTARPDGRWRLVERAADVHAARAAGQIGIIMGWQNARPIGDRLDRLHLFHRLGLRVMQLTYNRRNFLGDGCLEHANDGGLSRLGEDAVRLMNELGIAVDLSHVGERATLRAAELATGPVFITHANAHALVKTPRNKSDEAIRAVAATGGTIGLSIYGLFSWDGNPQRRPNLDDFLRHVDHVADLVGHEHLAFGTDLPAVRDLDLIAPIARMTLERSPGIIGDYVHAFGNDIRTRHIEGCASHAELVGVSAALLERGWDESQLRGFLGANLLRALDAAWAP